VPLFPGQEAAVTVAVPEEEVEVVEPLLLEATVLEAVTTVEMAAFFWSPAVAVDELSEEDPVEETEDPVEEIEDPVEEIEDPVEEIEDPVEEIEDPVE